MNAEQVVPRSWKGFAWSSAAVTLVFLLLLSLRVLATHAWDPLAFVLLTPADAAPGQTDNIGYDGRFVHHIAVNDFGDTTGLDEAAFRYQRILYPLLVKALSFGQAGWVPWMMLAVNLAAAALTTAILGEMLQRRGAGPWWALVLPFSVGYLIAIRFDLLEPLALCLVSAGILLLERGRAALSAVCLALAALAKELALPALAALALAELLGGRRKQAALLATAALPYLAWKGYLTLRFGVPPEMAEKSRLLLIPFAGFFRIEDGAARLVAALWTVLPAAFFGAWAAVDLLRGDRSDPGAQDALLVVAFAAVIAVLPAATWTDPLAVLRWGLGLIAVLLPWLAARHRRALPYAAALWLPSGLILFLVPGMF